MSLLLFLSCFFFAMGLALLSFGLGMKYQIHRLRPYVYLTMDGTEAILIKNTPHENDFK